jgi:hypothetical protein
LGTSWPVARRPGAASSTSARSRADPAEEAACHRRRTGEAQQPWLVQPAAEGPHHQPGAAADGIAQGAPTGGMQHREGGIPQAEQQQRAAHDDHHDYASRLPSAVWCPASFPARTAYSPHGGTIRRSRAPGVKAGRSRPPSQALPRAVMLPSHRSAPLCSAGERHSPRWRLASQATSASPVSLTEGSPSQWYCLMLVARRAQARDPGARPGVSGGGCLAVGRT